MISIFDKWFLDSKMKSVKVILGKKKYTKNENESLCFIKTLHMVTLLITWRLYMTPTLAPVSSDFFNTVW